MEQVPVEKVVIDAMISGVIARLRQGDVAGFQIQFAYWDVARPQDGEKLSEPLFLSDANLRQVMAHWQKFLDDNVRLTTPPSALPA